MPDIHTQLAEQLSAQLVTTMQGPLIEIAQCFENNQDSDGSWESCDITEAIWEILARLGVGKRCETCHFDFAWGGTDEPADWQCPNWGNHDCECGNIKDECTCEECSECGNIDCTCPICENCEYITSECTCVEAERIWPANA
jgi:hypothetical protein